MDSQKKKEIIDAFREALRRPDMSTTTIFAVGLIFLSRKIEVKEILSTVASLDKMRVASDRHLVLLERSCMLTMMDLVKERGTDSLTNLTSFAKQLEDIDIDDADRKAIVDEVLDIWRLCGDYGSFLHQAMLPKDVTDIAIWQIKRYLSEGDIFNPYAGMAEYGVRMGDEFTYLGHEPNPYLYLIGKINLDLCHLFKESAFFFNYEPLKVWTGLRPHVIVMTPPWGVKDSNGMYVDIVSMIQGLKSLAPNGVLLTIMPTESIKYADKTREPWEKLIEKENVVDTVISMPRHVFSNSVVPTTLLLLRKGRTKEDPIAMITTSALTEKNGPLVKLRSAEIKEAFERKDASCYIEISPNLLAQRDYVLSPEYHIELSTMKAGRKTVEMKEVARISDIDIYCNETSDNVTLVTIDDLHDHPYKGHLDLAKLQQRKIKKGLLVRRMVILKQKSLLVAQTGLMRPTVCMASETTPVIIDYDNILPIVVEEDKIDIDFLAYELSIARNIRSSIALTQNDLMHHVMYIPDTPEEQQQIYAESKRATQDAILSDNDLEARINEKVNDFKQLERTRRHNISTYIANTTLGYIYVQDKLKSLCDCLEEKDRQMEKLQKMIEDPTAIDTEAIVSLLSDEEIQRKRVSKTVEQIKDNIATMKDQFCIIRDMIRRFGSDDVFGKAEIVSLDRMLIDNNKPKPGKYTLEFKKDNVAFSSKEVFVKTSEFDFIQLCDNVMSNAYRHGFHMNDTHKNRIRISWRPTDDNKKVEIWFENNGYALPEGLNKEKYGRDGEVAGTYGNTGHGGNYVKKFTEHFNGDYDVIRNSPDAEFCTTIKIILPIERTI